MVVSASRGLTGRETDALTSSYDLDSAVRARPTGEPPGCEAEEFDVQRSLARARIADTLRAVAPALLTRNGTIPGSRFRNVHAVPLLEGLVTRRLAFPAYVLAYRYDGRLFRAVISGQEARRILGKTPVSPLRIALVVALGLGLLLLAVLFLTR